MKKFKQTLAVLTAVLMLCCMLPAGIFAEDEGIPIDEAHFPDENFRNYVLTANANAIPYGKIDADSNGILSSAEAARIHLIYVNGQHITDLTGIEYFTAMTELCCVSNGITALDLSHNTQLIELNCSRSGLTSLNVTHNPALEFLHCGENRFTELDVTQNHALKYLNCYVNKLTTLDISQNPALETLICERNYQITSLDVSHNPELNYIDCQTNAIPELDVSMLTKLDTLNCAANKLTSLNVNGADVLRNLYCKFNQLPSLDVTHNHALEELYCGANLLPELDVTQNPVLETLHCGSNLLPELDVTQNPVLKYLNCGGNLLPELDVTHNPVLETLYCGGNLLPELDVTQNPALKCLNCDYNRLDELNVSLNTALETLFCDNNQLTNLNLSDNAQLVAWNGNENSNIGFRCRNNRYTVYSNPFDLTTLPGHFVTDNASNWQGGTVDGNMLTFNGREATYNYDCENNLTANFKLIFSETPPPAPDGMGTITVVNPRANKTYYAYRVFDLAYSCDVPGEPPTSYAYSIENDSPWFTVVNDYASDHTHGLKLTQSAADPAHYIVEFASADNPIEGYGTFNPVDFARHLRDSQSSVTDTPVASRNSGSTPTGPIRLTTDGNAPVWTPARNNNVWVPLGYYFVNTGNGTFCGLDSADPDAYIYDKNEVPGWDVQPNSLYLGKVVAAEDPYADENRGTWGSTSDETIGSEAWFKIMAHVPAYEYWQQVEQYTFTDTLGDGFTYDEGSLKITLYSGLDTETGEPIAEPSMVLYDSEHTNVQGVTVTFDGNTFTVHLQLTGENAIDVDGQNGDENYYPDAHIVIEYTAHVDQDAVHNNVNTANMNWTWGVPNPVPNPPPDPTPTPEQPDPTPPPIPENPAIPGGVETHTYVYGLPFNKTIKGSDPAEYLTGAEFELYRDVDCSEKINLVVDNDLPEGAPTPTTEWKYYRVADATETTAAGFTSETIKAGRAVIWGLAPGTYYLLETKAPDGYNPLADPFPITICAVDNLETTEINEDNVDEHGYVSTDTFNVENAAGAELPGVGGIGTKIFYIVGALLMIAAAVLLTVRKKMSVRE